MSSSHIYINWLIVKINKLERWLPNPEFVMKVLSYLHQYEVSIPPEELEHLAAGDCGFGKDDW